MFIRVKFACRSCGNCADMNYGVPSVAGIKHAAPGCCDRFMRLVVAPLGVTWDQGWVSIDPSTGKDPSAADVIPAPHREHSIREWSRHMARRGWGVACSCGERYEVDDHDWVDAKLVNRWLEERVVTPENFTGSVGAIRGSEVTVTSVNDLLKSSMIAPFYFPEKETLRREPDRVRAFLGKEKSAAQKVVDNFSHMVDAVARMNGWCVSPLPRDEDPDCDAIARDIVEGVAKRKRLRSAMAAMSNAMTCVNSAAIYRDDGVYRMIDNARAADDAERTVEKMSGIKATAASAEWSRRVRAGVAALPKPGPVVCCEGDWDE
jgi:hypothetical protein